MEKRTLLLSGIPIAGALAVANLLFFWLAPKTDCTMLVYAFGFGIIIIQGIASTLLWHFFGSQKAMPMVVSGTAFAIGILVAGGVILALNATFDVALFFLIIFSVLYLICSGFLSCLAADELWNRAENAVIESPIPRHPIRDWIQNMRATFSIRRPGETDAERHVRNNREIPHDTLSDSQNAQHFPPPLPDRGISRWFSQGLSL